MGMAMNLDHQDWFEERKRQEKIQKRREYDKFRATNPDAKPPNKEHLHEMGMLINPEKEEWFKERARQEKLQKRREYDQFLVGFRNIIS